MGRTRNHYYAAAKSNRIVFQKWNPTKGLPSSEDVGSWSSIHTKMELEPDSSFGEVAIGRDIYPNYNHPFQSDDKAPIYEVLDEGNVQVHAAPMSHSVPFLGYVITEKEKTRSSTSRI